ncbi:M16 family metallopeptidase [Demequina pelophila]|uniref:M16 family metallopeptidase n=1 Tax=Demequina pelophila TaxID=1638984 RepID=UPI0007842AED|nr:pitrilysin family protein [Demequina pelophila]
MTVLAPKPELPEFTPWSVPVLEEWVTSAGTRGRHLESEGTMLHVFMNFRQPRDAEPRAIEGVTSLMGRLWNEGPVGLDAQQFATECARQGLQMQLSGGMRGAGIGLNVPMARVEGALALLARVLLEPRFSETDLERVRANVIAERKESRSTPSTVAEETLNSVLFAEHERQSRPGEGTEAEIARITREDIVERFETLLRPQALTVVSSGPLSTEEFQALLEGSLAAWFAREGRPADEDGEPAELREPGRLVFVDMPGRPQTTLKLATPTVPASDPRNGSLSLAAKILGQGLESRINSELRDQKGYTYGLSAYGNMGKDRGAFAVMGNVEAKSTGPAIADLLRIIADFRAEGPTADEHRRAVESKVASLPIRNQDPAAIARDTAGALMRGLGGDWSARQVEQYMASTPESIREHFAAIIPERMSLVLVGDAETCLPQLEAAGVTVDEVR